MPNNRKAFLCFAGLWLAVTPALCQPPPEKSNARDMFYSAGGLVIPVKAGAVLVSKPTPAARAKPDRTAALANTSPPRKRAAPAAAPAEPAPAAPSAERPAMPLGLRYSVLKQGSGGQAVEIDPDSVFLSGDRIRLGIQANDDAYLYIVLRGSSGNWSVLFPSPEISGGDNFVERARLYEVPSGHWFLFDEQEGEEKLFIVLCRQTEPNLENMIYAIRREQERTPSPAPAGESKPDRVLLSQAIRPIDDALVNRIRSQVFARDLIFEKVDEKSPGKKREKAVYVVNRTGSLGSRVVVDLTLNHK